MITGKIDVTKIVKDKLYKGEKGTYLNIVLIETPNSQYGDYMIKQEGKKEDYMPILGNAKNFVRSQDATNENLPDDDLPF